MSEAFITHLREQIASTKQDGLYKRERVITSPQRADIDVADGDHVINFCANNYLGLANHPDLIAAAKEGLDSHGFGMASVRFICGTQDIHKALESKISEFLGTEDTILYPSCFDANGGLFETLLGPEDAIISDALNHAILLMAYGCVKPNATAMPIIIWPCSKTSLIRPMPMAPGLR